jgi:hypothetical protein
MPLPVAGATLFSLLQSNFFSRLNLFGHVLPSMLLVPAHSELGHSDFSTL